MFPTEEDLHSGTARKRVLPTHRTAFPEEQTHVPCPPVDRLQGGEKRAHHKINNRAAHKKDTHIARKERDRSKRGESSERRRKNKTSTQSREISKEKTEIGDKWKSQHLWQGRQRLKRWWANAAQIKLSQPNTYTLSSMEYPKLPQGNSCLYCASSDAALSSHSHWLIILWHLLKFLGIDEADIARWFPE